jgi:hypothetical protein
MESRRGYREKTDKDNPTWVEEEKKEKDQADQRIERRS